MHLKAGYKLVELWEYSIQQGVNVVLMRHAPKSGSDESDLSPEGATLAFQYGVFLKSLSEDLRPEFFCTSKSRTRKTLELMFPDSDSRDYKSLPDLEVNRVTPYVQEQCNKLHAQIGHWRGYFLNHTYYFLEKLGGSYDEENPHTVVALRMERGIRTLFGYMNFKARAGCKGLVIYCGHSPSIEIGICRILGITLPELGGFLNPLDSLHLRMRDGAIELVARINPICDYVDLESENYYGYGAIK